MNMKRLSGFKKSEYWLILAPLLIIVGIGLTPLLKEKWSDAFPKPRVVKIKTKWNRAFAFSPDSKTYVIGTDNNPNPSALIVVDVQNATVERTLPGHRFYVQEVVFSADGSLMASVGFESANIWETKTWTQKHSFKSGWTSQQSNTNKSFECVAFTPDNKVLFAGGDGRLSAWNIEKGKQEYDLKIAGDSQVRSLAVSPNNKEVAFIIRDDKNDSEVEPTTKRLSPRWVSARTRLCLLNLQTRRWREVRRTTWSDVNEKVAWSADGKMLAWGGVIYKFSQRQNVTIESQGTIVELINTSNWKTRWKHRYSIKHAAFIHGISNLKFSSQYQKLYGTTGRYLCEWSVETAGLKYMKEPPEGTYSSWPLVSSNDSLVVFNNGYKLHLWKKKHLVMESHS